MMDHDAKAQQICAQIRKQLNLEDQALIATALRQAASSGWCDACAGTGKPISGGACMCDGTGLAQEAVAHLRQELMKLERTKPSAEEMLAAAVKMAMSVSEAELARLREEVLTLKDDFNDAIKSLRSENEQATAWSRRALQAEDKRRQAEEKRDEVLLDHAALLKQLRAAQKQVLELKAELLKR